MNNVLVTFAAIFMLPWLSLWVWSEPIWKYQPIPGGAFETKAIEVVSFLRGLDPKSPNFHGQVSLIMPALTRPEESSKEDRDLALDILRLKLNEALAGKSKDNRLFAIRTLGSLGVVNSDTWAQLKSLLESQDLEERYAVLGLLKKTRDRQSLELLKQCLDCPDPTTRFACSKILLAAPPLLEELSKRTLRALAEGNNPFSAQSAELLELYRARN